MQCVFGTLDAMWITVKLLAMLEGRHSAVQATVLLASANKTLFRVICHICGNNWMDISVGLIFLMDYCLTSIPYHNC